MPRTRNAGAASTQDRQAPLDPEDCLRRIAQHRDRQSFALLFAFFAPKLKSYFGRFGATDEVAEDLAQDTLLTLWRKAEQFDPARARASAWVFTIARNLRVDRLRHERHPDDFRADPPADAPATPEHQLHSAQSERLLHGAMDRLPPEQEEVMRLAYLEDQSHTEIAGRLGIPIGTVKSRIRLGAAHLRSSLSDLA